jgi:protein-tyrosine-phosphatase
MAEAIFNVLVELRGPFFDSADPRRPLIPKARSAGIFADFGSPAATYAEDAVRDLYGADLSEHRSRRTTNKNTEESRLILTMTAEHAEYMREHFPDVKERVYDIFDYAIQKDILLPDSSTLSHRPGIPDPYGRDMAVYEQTASVLMQVIEVLFPSIIVDLGVSERLPD